MTKLTKAGRTGLLVAFGAALDHLETMDMTELGKQHNEIGKVVEEAIATRSLAKYIPNIAAVSPYSLIALGMELATVAVQQGSFPTLGSLNSH